MKKKGRYYKSHYVVCMSQKMTEPVSVFLDSTPNTDYNIKLYVNVNGTLVSVCKRRFLIKSGKPTEDTMRDFIKEAPYPNCWSIHITKLADEIYNGHALSVYKVILYLKNGIVGLPIIDSQTQRTLGIIPRMDTLSKCEISDYLHLFDVFELGDDDEPFVPIIEMNEWRHVPQKLIVNISKPFRLITIDVC